MHQTQEEPPAEVAIQTPFGGGSYKGKRMAEVISILAVAGTLVLAALWWSHEKDTEKFQNSMVSILKEVSAANTTALKDLTVAQRESTAVQKEQNCLIRFSQSERQQNADFCKQMGQTR